MAVSRVRRCLYYIALHGIATLSFVSSLPMTSKPLTYKDAGVNIDAGNQLVERIKPLVAGTMRPEVLAGLGGFGGLFALQPGRYSEPVLVSGTDGVGTKLKLAHWLGKHDTIGVDLVAMCVNDVLVQGAEPLFFLDYFACGRLEVDVAAAVVGGIAEGCKLAGAALIGGETAEMPDMYADGEYDLAGFCVGAVEKSELVDGSAIRDADVIVGIGSSGPHSNGYSLIRRVLERSENPAIDGVSAAELLLQPTKIYVKPVLRVMQQTTVKGIAHITGGGITENIPRILPDGLCAQIDTGSWNQGPVFDWLAESGNIATDEMRRTFNCGIGMVLIVAEEDLDDVLACLAEEGEQAWRLGRICAGDSGVHYV